MLIDVGLTGTVHASSGCAPADVPPPAPRLRTGQREYGHTCYSHCSISDARLCPNNAR
ncbi:hypothetical protein JOH51_002779 [Rhizobium leguminosarum]|nr:hypothetical protein [Rhizobium leguminosarum]